MSRSRLPAWLRNAGILLWPSLLLIAPSIFYWHFGGVPHFLLHTLMGWDVGLLLLLAATLLGWRIRAWEGFIPALLAFWAMTPDFIYVTGPYHRDWMDLFLFHVSLDEILPYAVAIEAIVWLILFSSYVYFRAGLLTTPARSSRL